MIFYEVWEKNVRFITSTEIPEAYEQFGFALRVKKDKPEQIYIKKPKELKLDKFLVMLAKHYGGVCTWAVPDIDTLNSLGWSNDNRFEWGIAEAGTGDIVDDLIASTHHSLLSTSIKVFIKDSKPPVDKSGKMELAKVIIINGMHEKFYDLDFVILIYKEVWEAATDEEKVILIDHELSHCGCAGKCFLGGHDYSEFKHIINDHGIDWAEKLAERVKLMSED